MYYYLVDLQNTTTCWTIKDNSMGLRILAVMRSLSEQHKKYLEIVCVHPALLIPLFIGYVLLTILVGFYLALFLVSDIHDFTQQQRLLRRVLFELAFFGATFSIWLHYLFVAFRVFAPAFKLISREEQISEKKNYIFSVIQLVMVMTFAFAVIHYYVALFTETPAYIGMQLPQPEGGWGANISVIDRLMFVPSPETVIDCIYFNATTVATVGYGDIHPISLIAKTVTTIQIIFSFGLVVVILGWVIGKQHR